MKFGYVCRLFLAAVFSLGLVKCSSNQGQGEELTVVPIDVDKSSVQGEISRDNTGAETTNSENLSRGGPGDEFNNESSSIDATDSDTLRLMKGLAELADTNWRMTDDHKYDRYFYDEPATVFLIPPRLYHDGEVDREKSLGNWFGIHPREGYSMLSAQNPTFERAMDMVADDSTGWKVAADSGITFLVQGIPKLEPGPLEMAGQNISFLNQDYYAFELAGKQFALFTLHSDNGSYKELKLYFAQLSEPMKAQLIVVAPDYDETANFISWIGDLDNDGMPDFIRDNSQHYNTMLPSLYLSSMAEPGKLVKLVAWHRSVGC